MNTTRRSLLALTLAATTALAGMPGLALADGRNLAIDLVNEPSSLDPHMQWNPDSYYVYRNIFDNLVTRDDAGEITPQIATAWDRPSDTEMVFTLRDDVTFHDGSPLTAADVVFSVKRITDPAFGSPQLSQFSVITGAEAIDDTTVKLTTSSPYPALLAQLAKLSIVPAAVVEAMGNEAFNLAPVGSGPYSFGNWTRGVEVTLMRNDAYWGDKGPFETATFRAVPDASTRIADLQSGSADLVVSLDPDLAAQLAGSMGVEARPVLTERVGYLKLNPQRPGMDDLRMRQAVAYAIDRDLIVEGLSGGFDRPVGQMLTPAHVGWVEGFEGTPHDPDKARALVAELGDAAKIPLEFATAPVFDQRIVQALQQMLAEVGLNVNIEMTDMATYLGKARGEPAEGPELSFGRWSCACQDADGVLYPLLHSTSSWSSVRDADIDVVLESARVELDPDARLAAYKKVHEYVATEIPLVPLYQASVFYGVNEALKWTPTPNESMFLNRMEWSE